MERISHGDINMNQSYWQKTSSIQRCASIQDDMDTDIVIIGAGMAGVSLAYQLKDLSYRVIVVDKDQIASHTSGHTTAKLTVLHGKIYPLLKKHYNIHYAHLYFRSQEEALNTIKDIIRKEDIACDFQENDAYVYTDDSQYVSMIQELEYILKSFHVEVVKDSQHLASVGLKHQAVFHPLKYMYGLIDKCQKDGIVFYEKSMVESIERKKDGFILKVNHHKIRSRYVIHATRYPFIKKGIYFAKLFQTKENVDLRNKEENQSLLCIDHTDSYRPVQDKGIYIDMASQEWYALDSVPLRGVPYIGEIKPGSQEYVIYGFQKWGMTLSQVAAKLIKDLILQQENPYKSLYSCQYFSLSFAKEYQKKIMNSYYKGFIYPRFHYKKVNQIQNGEGAIVRENGKLKAVYKDENGKCHVFSPYCPHLKCIIEFDQKDKIWLCPCHQSTYDAYGHLIDGPSLHSLKKKEK